MLPLLLVICLVVAPGLSVAAERRVDKLRSYNISQFNETTVSGLSAGGFFAVQFHVAFSSIISAAGIAAGGPYYCAEGNLPVATTTCTTMPATIDVAWLVSLARNMRGIDDLGGLARARVFLYSGTKDTVVDPGVVKKLEEWYEAFVPSANVKTQYSIPSEHAWVTTDFGNECSFLGAPFINKCGYPLGERMFSWICGTSSNSTVLKSNLFTFDQSEFYTSAQSMDALGYVYVPTRCQGGKVQCRLHISFHGCLQGRLSVDTDYIMHTDLLPIAEANDIIVLFPQVEKSDLLPFNPKGCFDWWGYSGIEYATRDGAQMQAVYRMMRRIAALDLS